jgi:hypothetical protein
VDVGVRARLTTHVGLGVSLGYEWLRTFDRLPTSSDQQSIALLGGSLQLFARF